MINKETISFLEFRAWLTGLIVGKKGALPDLEDWKQIKEMLDKVVPDAITIQQPLQPAPMPVDYPTYPTQPMWVPNTDPYPFGNGTWCTSTSVSLSGTAEITIGDPPESVSETITVQMPEQMEFGFNFVGTDSDMEAQSKELGEALQMMIAEVENGQKESS